MADIFDDMAKAFKAGYDAGRAEAADEIERLREALQEIANIKISHEDGVNKYIVFKARTIARIAIGVTNYE